MIRLADFRPAPITLSGPKVEIVYRPADKQITVYDKVDLNNEPACYTTHKRNIAKVFAAVQAHFTKLTDMEMKDVQAVFREHNMPYHYWCRMD